MTKRVHVHVRLTDAEYQALLNACATQDEFLSERTEQGIPKGHEQAALDRALVKIRRTMRRATREGL